MNKIPISVNIVANGVVGYEGLSGGDNIFINLARLLRERGVEVNIFTWKHGHLMCEKNQLGDVNFFLSEAERFERLPFAFLYIIRAFLGIKKIREVVDSGYFDNKRVVIYSASDFYPDLLPSLYFKHRFSRSLWFAGFYLFAPNPFIGYDKSMKNLLYWLSQKLAYSLTGRYADSVCITSEPDIKYFQSPRLTNKDIFVMKGGLDYEHLKQFQKGGRKIYDAVYLGRFHPQKGVLEMMDIWNEVVKRKTGAKLAIIGLGALETQMKQKVRDYKMAKNVYFMGAKLDDDRNLILQQSRVILHPAVYDSGGMAASAGLACGLPGVCFDLPVFKTYYPTGFLKAKIGDIEDFAEKIVSLLENKELYLKVRREAITQAKEWDWQVRLGPLIGRLLG